MKRPSRLAIGIATIAVSTFALTACSSGGSDTTDSASSDDSFTVSLVGATAGDLSYGDSAIEGLKRADADLGSTSKVIEVPDVSQGETVLRSAATTSPDLIMSMSIPMDTLVAIAEQYPDLQFAAPSESNDRELPDNLSAYTINVHESSFLAGVVAGTLSQTKTVGAVLGGDNPGINQFFFGYKQGVLAACPDCTVDASYLNNEYSNPSLGKETALDMHSNGADIIYQVAGGTGLGVIEAAKQEGFYAIGVDSNQDDVEPGTVIVSSMKRVGDSVYALIKAAKDGDFESGFKSVGLAEGASGLSWDDGSTTFADNGPAVMTALLPDLDTALADYKAQILSGDLVVCDALNAPDSDECAALK